MTLNHDIVGKKAVLQIPWNYEQDMFVKRYISNAKWKNSKDILSLKVTANVISSLNFMLFERATLVDYAWGI